eukprot:2464910-Amphidinium_carterae.1
MFDGAQWPTYLAGLVESLAVALAVICWFHRLFALLTVERQVIKTALQKLCSGLRPNVESPSWLEEKVHELHCQRRLERIHRALQ